MNNMIYKFSWLSAIILMTFSLTAQDITITVESQYDIPDGTPIAVEIMVSGIPTVEYLDGFQGTISWDNRYISYISAEVKQGVTDFTLGDQVAEDYAENTSGRTFFASSNSIVTNGSIMTWTFLYHGAGSGACGFIKIDGSLLATEWMNSNWGTWTAALVDGQLCGTPTAISNETYSNEISIFPNPVSDYINIEFNMESECLLNISVSDLMGREVIRMNTQKYSTGQNILSIPVSSLSSGVYNVQITKQIGKEAKTINKKVVVR